jgi:hypothetical protein
VAKARRLRSERTPGYRTSRDRWRCYLDDEDNLYFYCPDCAEREFGDD